MNLKICAFLNSDRVGMVVCSLHTVVEATCDSWKTAKKTFIEMSSLNADRASAREKFNFYNTLAVLLKAVEGHKTTIDLRNESYITGIVNHADGCVYMKIQFYQVNKHNYFFFDADT